MSTTLEPEDDLALDDDRAAGEHGAAARGPGASPLPAAGTARSALHALFDAVHAEPWAHDFFALLRRIDALQPAAPRFGRSLRALHEAVRLGQDAELDFAPAALSSFGRDGSAPPRLGVRFFGLLGPHGPMPLHLTEYLRERQRFRNDPTAARFLDVFHHRLLALFYRAWADTQPTVQHDRPGDDRFAAWLGAAAGLAAACVPAEAPPPLPRAAQLHQTGLLAGRSRHPEGLEKLLMQCFGIAARVETHVVQWLAIEPGERSRLGAAGRRRAAGVAVLGRDATAGHKVRDRQYRFRVVLGPLSHAAYHAFLPGGDAWPALRDWIRQYAGLALRWDVALCLAAAEVPEARLGRGVGLGVDSWLGRRRLAPDRRSPADRCDLRVRPDTTVLRHRRRGASHA